MENNQYPSSFENTSKYSVGNKIELLACNSGADNCKEHLLVINKCYSEATNFHLEKDYLNSIESLKNAFLMTCELRQDSCIECANLFRSIIANSLENINSELENLISGVMKNKKYLKSYKKACMVLDDVKSELKKIS